CSLLSLQPPPAAPAATILPSPLTAAVATLARAAGRAGVRSSCSRSPATVQTPAPPAAGATTRLPSGLRTGAKSATHPSGWNPVLSATLAGARATTTSPSQVIAASRPPCGANASEFAQPIAAAPTCLLVASSQTRTIPSAAATASSRPSGLNAAPGLNGVVQPPFAGWRLPKPGSAAVRRPLLERQTLASP